MAGPPLEGIRVVDSTYVFALPYAGGLMADMGAEVIKVEGPGRPDVTRTGGFAGAFPENDIGDDWWNRPSTYNLIHRGKQSLTLDMTDERGREMFRQLVSISDVVMENFTPRVMRNLGAGLPEPPQDQARHHPGLQHRLRSRRRPLLRLSGPSHHAGRHPRSLLGYRLSWRGPGQGGRVVRGLSLHLDRLVSPLDRPCATATRPAKGSGWTSACTRPA